MVRLVFRPYTQVRRSICTSESLRASTRVSSGFALLKHSSPSFGSQHVCSFSNLSKSRNGRTMMRRTGVGRISPRRAELAFTFIAPEGFCHPKTRTRVRLLGPCFKTGRMKPYDRQRPRLVGACLLGGITTVQVHCTQSTMLAATTPRRGPPEGTNRDSSVRPDAVTRGYNTLRSELPSSKTFPPVRTVVDAGRRKVRCRAQETQRRQSFGSAPRRELTPDT